MARFARPMWAGEGGAFTQTDDRRRHCLRRSFVKRSPLTHLREHFAREVALVDALVVRGGGCVAADGVAG